MPRRCLCTDLAQHRLDAIGSATVDIGADIPEEGLIFIDLLKEMVDASEGPGVR